MTLDAPATSLSGLGFRVYPWELLMQRLGVELLPVFPPFSSCYGSRM